MSRESFGQWLRRSPQAQQFATLCQEEKKNVPCSIYDLYDEYRQTLGDDDEEYVPTRTDIEEIGYDALVEQVAQARAKGIMHARWEQERSTLGEARRQRKMARRMARKQSK